jgi:hypothetical protein
MRIGGQVQVAVLVVQVAVAQVAVVQVCRRMYRVQ